VRKYGFLCENRGVLRNTRPLSYEEIETLEQAILKLLVPNHSKDQRLAFDPKLDEQHTKNCFAATGINTLKVCTQSAAFF